MKEKQTKWLRKDTFEGLQGIILESRGGTKGTTKKRNLNYKTLLEQALANFKINRNNEVQIFVASKNNKEKYPTLESRLLVIDGKDTFDFESIDIDSFLPKLNKAIKESGQTGNEVGGNSTKRLFFYIKSSSKKENSIERTLDNVLQEFYFPYKGKEDKLQLQNALLQYLVEKLPSYNWSKEYVSSQENKDRIDIFGQSKTNDLPIIIELDPHRADSISKKFVSRMSLMKGKEILYVVFMYPGTKKMSLREAEKYLKYCNDLANRLGNKFLSYNLIP